MNHNILKFRNICAEDGIELTPNQATKFYKAYMVLRDEIKEAIEMCPSFYMDLCNRTTEQKLEDLKIMNSAGAKMTLKNYNELQSIIKKICEMEGHE